MITLISRNIILITFWLGTIILSGCREYSELKETYESGKPKTEIITRSPILGGDRTVVREIHYHFKGNIKSIREIKNDVQNGTTKAWWINSHPKYRGYMKNGLRNGKWHFYFEKNGELSSSGKYLNGKKNGVWKELWPNGKKKSSGDYQNGKKIGRWVTRDSTGRLATDNSCFEQNDSGVFISYYPGGREHKRYNCLRGKPHSNYTRQAVAKPGKAA